MDQVEELLRMLLDKVQGIEDKIQGIEDKIQGIEGELRGIRGEVQEIRGDMKEMRDEMKRLNLKFDSLDSDVSYVVHKLAEHDKDLYKLKQKLLAS